MFVQEGLVIKKLEGDLLQGLSYHLSFAFEGAKVHAMVGHR